MIGIDQAPTVGDLLPKAMGVFERSAAKILALEERWDPADGAPVFTVDGSYRARGWTEWTQGFQFGSALLQFDATGDRAFLDLGRSRTVERMAPHLHAHRRARPRLQQRQHLRHALAPRARRPDRRRSEWERQLLRAGAQGQRRRPGRGAGRRSRTAGSSTRSTARTRSSSTPSARCGRWRLSHRLGHRLLRRAGRVDQPARAPRAARAAPPPAFSVYYGRRTRSLRRARPHRAREPLQPGQRLVPRTKQPAGLFAVHDLDARAGLGDPRLRRAARVPRHGRRRRRLRTVRRHRRRCSSLDARGRAGDGRPLHRPSRPRRRHSVLGHRRARPAALGDWGSAPGGSVQRPRAGRQLRRRHCRAGAAAAGPLPDAAQRRGGEPYEQAGLGRSTRSSIPAARTCQHAARTTKACCCTRSTTGPMAGTTCRPARGSRAASRASGATTTPVRPPSTCCGSAERRAVSDLLRSCGEPR